MTFYRAHFRSGQSQKYEATDKDHVIRQIGNEKGWSIVACNINVIDIEELAPVEMAPVENIRFDDKGNIIADCTVSAETAKEIRDDFPHVNIMSDSEPMIETQLFGAEFIRTQRSDIAKRLRKFADAIERGEADARIFEKGGSYVEHDGEPGDEHVSKEIGAHAVILTLSAPGSEVTIEKHRVEHAMVCLFGAEPGRDWRKEPRDAEFTSEKEKHSDSGLLAPAPRCGDISDHEGMLIKCCPQARPRRRSPLHLARER